MAMSLTHKQAELLAFISQFQLENDGVAPSFEEMKEALCLKSKSGVHRLIQALEERGRIVRRHNRNRAIEIAPDTEELTRFPSCLLIAELARRGENKRRAS